MSWASTPTTPSGRLAMGFSFARRPQGAAIFEVTIGLLLTVRQRCRDAVEKSLVVITCGKDLPKEGTIEDKANGKTQHLVEYLLF